MFVQMSPHSEYPILNTTNFPYPTHLLTLQKSFRFNKILSSLQNLPLSCLVGHDSDHAYASLD